MPNSPTSLERLFKSNARMSPSRSRKPTQVLSSRRAALNRAAHALDNLKEAKTKHAELTQNIRKLGREYYSKLEVAEKKHAKLTQNIQKLAREYHKLARRAALNQSANLKTGPLSNIELRRVRIAAQMAKNMSIAARTMRHWGVPDNLGHRVAQTMPLQSAHYAGIR